MLVSFIVIEKQALITGGSLIYANLTRDMSYYTSDSAWVTRYNKAIWLSRSGSYAEAKMLLAPLLNDTTIARRAEIAELYGDLIYTTSGSIDDTMRMYERSLSFSPSDRVTEKITYIRNKEQVKKNPPNPLSQGGTQDSKSGSIMLELKKAELQKTA